MNTALPQDILGVLLSPESTMAQVQRAITEAEKFDLPKSASIGISSNVTVSILEIFLRKHALINGVRLTVHQGNYDDHLRDMETFAAKGVEHVVFLPFFDNILPSFEAQLGSLTSEQIEAKAADLKERYRLVFEKASTFRSVFVCGFHRFSSISRTNDPVASTLIQFNEILREVSEKYSNMHMLDMQNIVETIGHSDAFDPRFYFRTKTPYSPVFLNQLASHVCSASRGFGSYFYKALVLDCDNTLWGGIIGEDLINGIKLDAYDYPGNIFWRAQHEFALLERSGVLLCLCSKNNPQDVEEVFHKHSSMVLKDSNIVLKKVNWNNKVQNLREIASELNIGLDSLVFLDDSEFECSAARTQLPMVHTVMVPKALPEYPAVIETIKSLFLSGGITAESSSKTLQYQQKAEAEKLKAQFNSQDDYLAALGLKVELSRNAIGSIPRISELTMKSNQFNLTTHRYSEAEIRTLMENNDSDVYSMVVSDKFGNAGLTGVAVVLYQGNEAIIQAFLMSCRVIGRGVEFVVWATIMKEAMKHSCTKMQARFLSTAKNAQVKEFYDGLGFTLLDEAEDGTRNYSCILDGFTLAKTDWVEVVYAG
jgi:FkbH-like protein